MLLRLLSNTQGHRVHFFVPGLGIPGLNQLRPLRQPSSLPASMATLALGCICEDAQAGRYVTYVLIALSFASWLLPNL